MTTTGTQVGVRASTPVAYSDEERGWGWILFAATAMGLSGVMRIFDSIWAFSYHGALPDNLKNATFGSDLRNYAWAWLAVGCLLILTSLMLLTKSQFARWVGILAAAVAMISAVTWLPYYPVWSIVYIGLGGLVIYALAVHGGRETA